MDYCPVNDIKQEVLNPDPVDPSNLLIGFGGVRSTTRIPFIKKLKKLSLRKSQHSTDKLSEKTKKTFSKYAFWHASNHPCLTLTINKNMKTNMRHLIEFLYIFVKSYHNSNFC